MLDLNDVDLTLSLRRREGERRLAAAQRRLLQLRLVTAGLIGDGRPGPPICVVFEGWDASGKGGTIKRLVAGLDLRHFHVAAFAKPTPIEKAHNFLWRFYPELPGWGDMTVFDRSWYGRVLVERVEGFATREEWERAYGEIVSFERSLALEGTVMLKFWMHISHEEQERRFDRRLRDPLRAWKLGDEDWRNREKREEYEAAVRDMLALTDSELAPWVIVEAEDKRYARVKVAEAVVAHVEDGLRRVGIKPPPPLDAQAEADFTIGGLRLGTA